MLMLHRHCVSLALYERKCDDYNDLVEKYHALKLAGATPPAEPKPGRVVQAAPDADEMAELRLREHLLDEGAKQFAKARGIPVEQARAALAESLNVGLGGSVMDPPV